jgi:hypothetical protein
MEVLFQDRYKFQQTRLIGDNQVGGLGIMDG